MDPDGKTVVIYGHEYTVHGGSAPEYVDEVAAYLDTRMREVAESAKQVSSLRVAVLAALNITDELFRERQRQSRSLQELETRAEALARRLEESV